MVNNLYFLQILGAVSKKWFSRILGSVNLANPQFPGNHNEFHGKILVSTKSKSKTLYCCSFTGKSSFISLFTCMKDVEDVSPVSCT